MSDVRLFFDFGSTFTKCAAFDLSSETLLARVQTPSTVDTDITAGLLNAIDLLRLEAHVTDQVIRNASACSSAAGGLKLAVIGLVPDYTTKAGNLAALGAGAKVIGSFSYELTRAEILELEALNPDIVLLTGGTDGGNRKIITANARRLADSSVKNIIAAGNKSARDDIEEAFAGSGKNVIFAPNVMPEFGKLDIDEVNRHIRELFISRIMDAKGIAKVSDIISGVKMPTPAAVLSAVQLIAEGTDGEPGYGELLAIDVGGATTDVYSIASGAPSKEGVHVIGIPEPYAKRTVEGDLGLYHNLENLSALSAKGLNKEELETFSQSIRDLRARLSIPEGETLTRHQLSLSRIAVNTAAARHAGHLESVMTSGGETWIQRGKDLSNVKLVIGAGGPVAFSSDPAYVLSGAEYSAEKPLVLCPQKPRYMLDERYILFAVGLLSETDAKKALRIAKKYLRKIQ